MTTLRNKISVQFMDIGDVNEMVGVIEALNPEVVKFCFTDPGAVIQVMLRVPHIKGVYRMWWQTWHAGTSNQFHVLADYIRGRHGRFDPVDAVNEWFLIDKVAQGLAPILNAPNDVKSRLWVEGYNETGDHAANGARAYFEFERERCRKLASFGLHGAVISSGVGWELDFKLAQEVGLLDILQNGGHWLSTHGYGDKIMNVLHGAMQPINDDGDLAHSWKHYRDTRVVESEDMLNSWLAFRCSQEQAELEARGYDIIQVITEIGLDASAEWITDRGDSGAIKSAEGFLREKGLLVNQSLAEYYVEELLYWELQARKYKNVIGGCIYTYGGVLWPSFDIRDMGVIPRLAEKLRQHPNTGDSPDPVPDTTCSVTTSLAQVNVRTAPVVDTSTYFDPRLYITQGQKIKAIGTVRGANNSLWHVVDYNGFKGYIAGGQYSQLVGSCDDLPDLTDPEPIDELEVARKRIADLELELRIKNAALGILVTNETTILAMIKRIKS